MYKPYKPVKLTKKTATTLIQRVFGTIPKAVISGPKGDGEAVIFTALTGPQGLEVKAENDWYNHNGCIRLTVSDSSGGSCLTMYFSPNTFERDYSAEEFDKKEAAREARERWVAEVGREQAHKLVDLYWGN